MAGAYRPGDGLPGEVVHPGEFGVSRGTYREAMRAPIAKGLVEGQPKAGTRVLPRRRRNMLDPEVLARRRRPADDGSGPAGHGAPDTRDRRRAGGGPAVPRNDPGRIRQGRADRPGIAAGVEWSTRFEQRTRVLPRDPVPDHRRVFDAIAAGDGEDASRRMRLPVRLAFEDIWFGMGATPGGKR
jgi:DNA-binding FadR family transcriptional regulator